MEEQKNIIVIKEFNGKYKINQNYLTIAEALREKFKELQFVPVNSILFIENLEDKKKNKNKIVFAQISKVPEKWEDIIYQTTGKKFMYMLEIFKENTSEMSREQMIALIYHELHHIQIIDGEFKLVGHDVEDWTNMIEKLGVNWNSTKSDIPDLLDEDVDWDSITGPAMNIFHDNLPLRLVK